MKITATSNSLKDTEVIAKQLAINLRGGEVIELVGDLGAGKTTLVRSLVPALGGADEVASPSFTISKVYKTPKFAVHHFDFYRLGDPGIVALELAELIGDPKAVIIVEWGENVRDVLTDKKLTINIKVSDDDKRIFEFAYPAEFHYLTEGIK